MLVASMWPNAPTEASDGDGSHSTARDIFELSALLVLLLSGVEVQNPADPSAVVARIREVRPDARPPLLAVIERGISPDASLRYQTPADLVEALRTAMADSPVSSEWVIGFTVTAGFHLFSPE